MKLNHINLAVTDLQGATQFLTTYFGLRNEWQEAEAGEGSGGGSGEKEPKMTVLFDDDDFVLTLFKTGQAKYPGIFHIGFFQENEEAVNEIYHRLKSDGFDVEPPVQSHGWTFTVLAPGGILIEVAA